MEHSGLHTTVLLHEAIDALVTNPDGIYVDGTFGRGGHTRELLSRLGPGARVIGSVKGSPITFGNFFLGFEHPLSDSKVQNDRATAFIDRDLPLKAGQSVTYSSVIGIAQTGQLRRDFLSYIERERAHPYRTFLHYNSWYDLGYFNPYDEAGALDRINTFGRAIKPRAIASICCSPPDRSPAR